MKISDKWKKIIFAGIIIIAIGIKNLKLSSYKSDNGIQYIFDKKKPNPKR